LALISWFTGIKVKQSNEKYLEFLLNDCVENQKKLSFQKISNFLIDKITPIT